MASTDPVHVLRGHLGDVQSLSFLSEDHLYAGDCTGELRLWDLSSCRTDFTARLHCGNAGILQLVYLPGYGILLSQGRDGCLKLWPAGRTGALDRSQPMHEIRTESFNFCRCAVWAPSLGRQVVESQPAATAHGAEKGLAGNPQELLVACAGHDPSDIGIWRPAEAPAFALKLSLSQVSGNGAGTRHGMCMALAFLPAPTNTSLAQALPPRSFSTDSSCSVAAVANGLESSACSASGGGDSITPTEPQFIIAGYEDGVVALWDLRRSDRPLGSLRAHTEPVMSLDVRARARGLSRSAAAAACGDSNIAAACTAAAVEHNGSREAKTLAGGATLYDLVSGSADDQICCCEVRPALAQPLTLVKQLRLRESGTADVRIRADGRLFACGLWDGRVRLYSLRRQEPLAVLKYHRSQVTAVAFSPETNTLASASRDATIALWSVYSSSDPMQR